MNLRFTKFIAFFAVSLVAALNPATAQVIQNNVPGLEILPLETPELIISEANILVDGRVDRQLITKYSLEFCQGLTLTDFIDVNDIHDEWEDLTEWKLRAVILELQDNHPLGVLERYPSTTG